MGSRTSFTELDINEIEKGSASFACPCCKTELQFKVRTKILGVYEVDNSEDRKPKQVSESTSKYTSSQIAILNEARANSVIDAFINTVKAALPTNLPNDMELFFLHFITKAVRMRSPQFAIRLCLPESERSGNLELWKWGQIAGVTVNGVLKTFIPLQLVIGKPLPASLVTNGNQIKSEQPKTNLAHWVKTRNGYVVGHGFLFGELKRKAAGQFVV